MLEKHLQYNDDFPPEKAFVNIFNGYELKQPTKKLNPRKDILKQIYAFYDTQQEVVLTKRANWKSMLDFQFGF